MTFGGFDEGRHAAPMAEINVTPMVDVMLVLLVIFILAAPLLTHGLRLDLPIAAGAPLPAPAAAVVLSIDAAGKLYWNDDAIAPGALAARMAVAAAQNPQPDLQLRADRATRYDVIADVLSAAQASNLVKIGFVTEPKPGADALPLKSSPVMPAAATSSTGSR
ncbi:MAG: biopolymer transporter ExbD [Herminiimonas sp.]|nr:biopolymer transporter ExbD [Herminiimonas sp.]